MVPSSSDAVPTGAPAPAAGSSAARDGVISAFVLGWHVAELFHAPLPRSSQQRQARPGKLIGIGELDPLSRARLLLAQVQADLDRARRYDDSGQPSPDLDPVQSLLQAEIRQPGELQSAVAQLHQQLLMTLTAADFRLGKAYGLGRALAETTLVPDARNPQTFQQVFARYRLPNLLGWLADLKSAFPTHAAEAVRGSLQAWAAWAEAPALRVAVDGQRRPVDWDSSADRESVTRALHRQGQLWRAILSGEKDGVDLLSTDDYMVAADQLLRHIRQLTLRLLRRFWIATAVLASILAAALVTIFTARAASPLLAAVVTAVGAVGLSWRGAASGLGRVLAEAQRPLWESELDVVVAKAVTVMPWERRTGDRPVAAGQRGREV